jgi:hypothetical protein
MCADAANINTDYTLMQIVFTNVPPTPNIVPLFWNIGKKVLNGYFREVDNYLAHVAQNVTIAIVNDYFSIEHYLIIFL